MAPKRYESFVECLESACQGPYQTSKYLDLVSTSGLTPNTVYIGNKFPSSNHNIVIYSFNIKTTTGRRKTIIFRKRYGKVDWNNFYDYLRSINWGTFFTENNTDTLTNILYHNIKSILNKIAASEY